MMGEHSCIVGEPQTKPVFRINGVSNPIDEPHDFVDQLHGLLCCIEASLDDGDRGPLNREIMRSALNAALTLTHLVGESLAHVDEQRRAYNARAQA